jgi:Transposase, Mutator family
MVILLLLVYRSRSAVGRDTGPSEVEPLWSGFLKPRSSGAKMRGRWPELAAVMDDGEHNVLPYMAFPTEHRKLRSTNPLERLNKEVMRAPGSRNRAFRPARISAMTAEATKRLLHLRVCSFCQLR